MKTEKPRVNPQMQALLVPNGLPSAPIVPAASSIASLNEAGLSANAKSKIHRLLPESVKKPQIFRNSLLKSST